MKEMKSALDMGVQNKLPSLCILEFRSKSKIWFNKKLQMGDKRDLPAANGN